MFGILLLALCLLAIGPSAASVPEPVIEGSDEGVNVVVALPFSRRGVGSSMVEFYRGFLLAADSLKDRGVSLNITAFDSDEPMTVHQEALREAALVICPQDSSKVAQLSLLGREGEAVVVSPFYRWSEEIYTNPNFYALNPPLRMEDRETLRLLSAVEGNSHVLLIETGGKQSSLAGRIKAEIMDLRVISLEQATDNLADVLKETVGRTLVVLSSQDRESMQIVVSTLSGLRREEPDLDFCLLGPSDWLRYAGAGGTVFEDFFAVDTYVSSLYHIDYGQPILHRLEGAWLDAFEDAMPLGYPSMGVYGWDIAMTFLAQGGGQLQHKFRFERATEGGGWVNVGVNLVHYDRSHGVSLIAIDN